LFEAAQKKTFGELGLVQAIKSALAILEQLKYLHCRVDRGTFFV